MATVLDQISELESINELELVWPKFEDIATQMGLPHVIYAVANNDNTQSYYYNGILDEGYQDENFYDPFLDYCCHNYDETYTGVEFLSDLLADYPELNEEATVFIKKAERHGFRSGIGIPIRLTGSNRYGGFNLGTSLPRNTFLKQFAGKTDSIRLLCVMVQRHIESLMDQTGVLSASLEDKSTDFDRTLFESLTKREREILRSLSTGNSRSQCAIEFCVSEATVSTHIKNIYRKLGVNNKVEAARVVFSAQEKA